MHTECVDASKMPKWVRRGGLGVLPELLSSSLAYPLFFLPSSSPSFSSFSPLARTFTHARTHTRASQCKSSCTSALPESEPLLPEHCFFCCLVLSGLQADRGRQGVHRFLTTVVSHDARLFFSASASIMRLVSADQRPLGACRRDERVLWKRRDDMQVVITVDTRR